MLLREILRRRQEEFDRLQERIEQNREQRERAQRNEN